LPPVFWRAVYRSWWGKIDLKCWICPCQPWEPWLHVYPGLAWDTMYSRTMALRLFLGRHLLNVDSKSYFTSSGVSFPDAVIYSNSSRDQHPCRSLHHLRQSVRHGTMVLAIWFQISFFGARCKTLHVPPDPTRREPQHKFWLKVAPVHWHDGRTLF
jgi:hypothetical protein